MAQLLIHFTERDLARTRVSPVPDALWELVLSLHRLQQRRRSGGPSVPVPADVAQWRAGALAVLAGHDVGRQVHRHLLPLTPVSSYFPDFLTPYEGLYGLGQGVDTVLSTPRRQIRYELDKLTTRSGAPSWGGELADGKSQALHVLGDTLRGYFTTALAPAWDAITARIRIEHTRLVGIRTAHGSHAMLSSLHPAATWHPRDRILETAYPVPLTIHLDGRGLTLIPSWFCTGSPVSLADPEQPPVLLYSLTHDALPKPAPGALAKLIGSTRAKILTTISIGTPTSLIQRRTGISSSQLSRHAAVLRDNALITEARHGGHTFYTRTPLGNTLIADP